MKHTLTVINFLTLLIGSFGQTDNSTIPGGVISEIFHLITNGTLEHFFGCETESDFVQEDLTLYLYNRNITDRVELTNSNFHEVDPSKDLKIIFAGWLQKIDDTLMLDMVRAYLTRYDCNVIFVDYINLSGDEYSQSYCNVVRGSEILGDFFCEMYRAGYLDFSRVHVTGLSIGAHVSGLIGQRVKKQCRQTIDRITALDPAGPIFQNQDVPKRLDKSDANFVDVIHTNMGMFGYYGSIGHVDFFPNCGTIQPGCIKPTSLDMSDIVTSILEFIICNHFRSVKLFIESIYGPVFHAKSCTVCANKKLKAKCLGADIINSKHIIMGEDCPRNPPAKKFYIKTNSKSPYAISMF